MAIEIKRRAIKASNPETKRVEKLIPHWIVLYRDGMSAVDIANRFSVTSSTVLRRLRWEGVNIRTRSEVKLGSLNPMWRFDDVGNGGLHSWVRLRLPKVKACSLCGGKRNIDLANVSPTYNKATYNRDIKNWRWLCRRCHMNSDGRFKNMYHGGMKPRQTVCDVCPRRHEARGYCTRHYSQFMRKGRVWS